VRDHITERNLVIKGGCELRGAGRGESSNGGHEMDDNIWVWQVTTVEPPDVTGFDVEAIDGHVGKVDEASYENDRGALIVDTGFWIFGKKRTLPAGIIAAIDPDERKVLVRCTKDDIKAAPDYDDVLHEEEAYRSGVASHYAGLTGDPIAPTPGIEHQPNLH
jgi:hypothetical protein